MTSGERHSRLRKARQHAGLERQRDVYERYPSWNRNTYKSNENGNAPFSFDQAKVYAKAFGVRAEWLYDGVEPMTAPKPLRLQTPHTLRSVPIISEVAAGALADPTTQIEPGTEAIEISGLPPGDYFATRVVGTSMNRISPPGSLILVDRADREPIRGRRYIFGRRGETTYKRFETEPLRLEPETTDPESNPTIFPRSEEDWVVIGRVRLTLLDDL